MKRFRQQWTDLGLCGLGTAVALCASIGCAPMPEEGAEGTEKAQAAISTPPWLGAGTSIPTATGSWSFSLPSMVSGTFYFVARAGNIPAQFGVSATHTAFQAFGTISYSCVPNGPLFTFPIASSAAPIRADLDRPSFMLVPQDAPCQSVLQSPSGFPAQLSLSYRPVANQYEIPAVPFGDGFLQMGDEFNFFPATQSRLSAGVVSRSGVLTIPAGVQKIGLYIRYDQPHSASGFIKVSLHRSDTGGTVAVRNSVEFFATPEIYGIPAGVTGYPAWADAYVELATPSLSTSRDYYARLEFRSGQITYVDAVWAKVVTRLF